MKQLRCAVILLVLLPSLASAQIAHPVWGNVTVPGASRSLQRTVSSQATETASSSRTPSTSRNFTLRVCDRVSRRFASDHSVMERVNRRLQNRFGFSCDATGVPAYEPISTDDSDIDETAPSSASALTVAIDRFGPVGDDVPRGGTNVPMLTFIAAASCDGSVEIEAITVSDFAAGHAGDVTGVWIERDGLRLSRVRPMKRDKTVNITFRRPVIIPACEAVTFDVQAAFARDALVNGRHRFSIQSPDDIRTKELIEGEFPIIGNQFRLSTIQTGIVTVEFKDVDTTADIEGTSRQVIGRFTVTANSREDQVMHRMTFENDGRADDGDFVGIYVRARQGRARFTHVEATTQRDMVVLPFDPPFPVRENEIIELEIVSDLVAGTGSTLELGFQEVVDLFAVGSLTGVGKNGQLYGATVEMRGGPARVRVR